MTEPGRPLDEDAALRLLVSGADALGSQSAGACPDEGALASYLDATVGDGERAVVESHLSRCPACRTIVAALSSFGLPARSRGEPAPATPSSPPAPVPGPAAFPRAFGPYTLLRRIGGGGMGEVYEAEHEGRARREALKQLRPGLDGDSRAAERFLREIRASARVAHDHVVPVWDSGEIDGVPYYTMPLLPGPSMEQILEDVRGVAEPVPGRAAGEVLDRHGVPAPPFECPDDRTAYLRRVAAALAGVASGLAAIHRAGMVHRDVKPSNIVLDGRRRALLADFGLVRLDASRITRATETLGTPAYMAPEQLVDGAAVDGRADVYALGATLHEIVTLHRPFEGRTIGETVGRILRGAIRPARDVNPAVPRDLDVILSRCLERLPGDRYPDAESLARDLTSFSRGEPIAARPLSWLARATRALARRRAHFGIAAALVAVLGFAAYLRPGSLSVRSLPSASLALDGVGIGRTPLGPHDVRAGEHHLALRREGFEPFDRAVVVGRGATYDLDVALRALDPADPRTLDLLAAERGVERSRVTVAQDRDPVAAADLAVLLPRGTLRDAPAAVSVWAESPVHEVSVRLRAAGAPEDASPLHAWTAGTVFRGATLSLPDDVRARLVPGRWRLDIAGAKRAGAAAEFEIADPAATARIDAEVLSATRGFAADDPSTGFLRAEVLLRRDRLADALAEAERLRQTLGDRREVARLALAALDRAGLRDVGPWFDWAARYLRAEK